MISPVLTTMRAEASATTGVKGSDVYATTGDPRLDLSVKCVRGTDAPTLQAAVKAVLAMNTQEAIEDAFVTAFHARNIRGSGKGERLIFYHMFQALCRAYPTLAFALLDLIPHYGCWKDLFVLANHTNPDPAYSVATRMYNAIIDLTVKQLTADAVPGATKTLVAKWAPREGSAEFKSIARDIAGRLFAPDGHNHSAQMRLYRKMLSKLNAELNTVETYMCADRWDEIDPKGVPGRAGKLYTKAFLNEPTTYKSLPKVVSYGLYDQEKYESDGEDEAGAEAGAGSEFRHADSEKRMACRKTFKEYYARAAKGEVKIHGADTIFPHELIKQVARETLSAEQKDHIRGVWRSMVSAMEVGGGLKRSIMMSDFSGSMESSSCGDTPYWVSMALGILGSEVCGEGFKDRLMTFDSDPQWHTFAPGSDIFERVRTIRDSRIGVGLSTDFQKAMDLILVTLIDKRVPPGEEPENLIVLTDMGWDAACLENETSAYTGNRYHRVVKKAPWESQIDTIQKAYHAAGYVAPRIVIWNLAASYSDNLHATATTPGVAMLSGWSPSQFKILQKEGPRQMTAYEMLRVELDDPQYDRIRQRIRYTLATATSD